MEDALKQLQDQLSQKTSDEIPIEAIDYVELYVGNARQAAHFYRTGFGFEVVAYSGPETGVRDRVSYVLRQGDIQLVVTAGLDLDHPIAQLVALHGDGVHDVALRVPDAQTAFQDATNRGAAGESAPEELRDDCGVARRASIAAYGHTVHSFIERDRYSGPFLPGFQEMHIQGESAGLRLVDHVVANVEHGRMDEWVDFYSRVLGFEQLVHYDDKDISTEYSALMSKVMQNGSGRVKFPINEPAQGRKKSQIQEYLDFYRGAGVQHVALLTDDIVSTVTTLKSNGIGFLTVPETYYAALSERVGKIDEPLEELARLGILVDRDEDGYLLQIFTKPVQDRPTLFYEVIERRGSGGFGIGNFKALFESIEREQERRGNL
jgi:4-hydroxyphenylpyruvate dioxygenase